MSEKFIYVLFAPIPFNIEKSLKMILNCFPYLFKAFAHLPSGSGDFSYVVSGKSIPLLSMEVCSFFVSSF